MALYFITYDLRTNGNYQPLYDELASFEAVRVFDWTWCFNRIDTNPEGLRDYFMQFLDAEDGIAISEVTSWASSNTEGTPEQLGAE